MFCPKCGKENPNDARFCSACGYALTPFQQREEGAPSQQQPSQPIMHFPGAAAAPQRPREKKNTIALVFGILGAVLAFLGGLLWASCADMINCSDALPEMDGVWLYTMFFVVLGIGGSVISLIGGIQAYNYGRGRFVLSFIGLLFQLGCLAVQIVLLMSIEGKVSFFSLSFTIVALILLFAETIFSAAKNPNKKPKESKKK